MFCPKCGKSDQSINTYCRLCGNFLPDFDKLKPAETTPQQHLTANLWLSAMTALAGIGLAIALYSIFLGKGDVHWIVYLTAGFLTAMSAWQIQVFIRTMKVKKHFKRPGATALTEEVPALDQNKSKGELPEADFESFVPASVVEPTTNKLGVPAKNDSKTS